MSKLKKAQSKTGKTGTVIEERKIDDKPEEHGLRVDRKEAPVKKRRKKVKRKNPFAKRGKGPDGHSRK